jgi:uncharacterized protein
MKKGSDFLKVVIAGGSGFIGKAISEYFANNRHDVYILTRRQQTLTPERNITNIEWMTGTFKLTSALEGADVFINLAGESINSGRWNEKRKQQILQSRLLASEELLDIIKNLTNKPKLLINASAIGYYGVSDTLTFSEESQSIGHDFLAETVKQWENTTSKAQTYGVQTVFCRFGIVLARTGGALPKMVLPYQFYIGGKLGRGTQWVSWIHIEDMVRAIHFIIENNTIEGAVNFTAPEPVTMDEFGKNISKVLNRPHWLPTPGFALKFVLGEMSMLMLEGQRVVPKKLLDYGFEFKYPTSIKAFEDIFNH